MKSFFLVSMLALSFSSVAEDELLPIGEPADEEVLATPTASVTETVVESEPINVDGYVKEKEVAADPELQTIRSEIEKQKKEIVLNKVKAKQFKELGKSTEKLAETTEEMLLEKKAVQEEIANYNLKVKCLQEDNPGADCDKFVRRRR